nr:site-specific DNA-methyltransferase [Leptolyngbya sp. FACHB-60]
MIYMDPPYGVKFGSNFQPFVRKRDVTHNDDDNMTREPEMVQAYRDTWELGLHSYLTYLRDRLLLARDLLTPSGSVFVQISDENVHHVRELMDEIFGKENFCSLLICRKTSALNSPLAKVNVIPASADFLLWYSRDRSKLKYKQLYIEKKLDGDGGDHYRQVDLPDGSSRSLHPKEIANPNLLPPGSNIFQNDNLISQGYSEKLSRTFEYEGKVFSPGNNSHWKTTIEGLKVLAQRNRLSITGKTLRYKRHFNDFPVMMVNSIWDDVGADQNKAYVVQTPIAIISRCLLMTTDPGDLVLDPTCGSGTTPYVAEHWGRRWITADVSRVPLALARQRLLTATFPYYVLKDEARGPAGGFVYKRKQNRKGEEVGGIVPHITLKSIANNEQPDEEVLVDRPEKDNNYTRVTGPFTVEAVIPTPIDADTDTDDEIAPANDASLSFDDRMLEVLRKSPVLRLEGNRTLDFQQVRKPAKTLYLSAEALVKASDSHSPSLEDVVDEALEHNSDRLPLSLKPVAFVFGPENGQIVERTVYESAKEAAAKNYSHLYVIGFAIHPNARRLIDQCDDIVGIPATYVQATPDLLMGDLLKNMRSSQIFSVCGLPEIAVHAAEHLEDAPRYQVELLGLDVFDPGTMDTYHRGANDVPAWFLDTDYNGLCFHVCQAFFPRTSAWDPQKSPQRHLRRFRVGAPVRNYQRPL